MSFKEDMEALGLKQGQGDIGKRLYFSDKAWTTIHDELVKAGFSWVWNQVDHRHEYRKGDDLLHLTPVDSHQRVFVRKSKGE